MLGINESANKLWIIFMLYPQGFSHVEYAKSLYF